MILALLMSAAALAPSYVATTVESRRLTLAVRERRISRVATTVVRYECDQFGDVGPLRIRLAPDAHVDARGRFSFVTGTRAERVGVAGTLRRDGTVTGRIRVSGTIGTGERCESPAIRFR